MSWTWIMNCNGLVDSLNFIHNIGRALVEWWVQRIYRYQPCKSQVELRYNSYSLFVYIVTIIRGRLRHHHHFVPAARQSNCPPLIKGSDGVPLAPKEHHQHTLTVFYSSFIHLYLSIRVRILMRKFIDSLLRLTHVKWLRVILMSK